MGAPHTFAPGHPEHLVHADVQPQRLKPVHNGHIALGALLLQPAQLFLHGGNVVRQPETQNVRFPHVCYAGQFAAAHQLHTQFPSGGLGLVQPGNRIVVGNRHGHKARLFGQSHELGRGVRAVGGRGVGMQINKTHGASSIRQNMRHHKAATRSDQMRGSAGEPSPGSRRPRRGLELRAP